MAPMHGWKDDAEYIRYNLPPPPRWPAYHPWFAVVGMIGLNALLIYALFHKLGIIR